MLYCLIYRMPDGSVQIGRLGRKFYDQVAAGVSPGSVAEEIASKDKPEGTVSWRLVEAIKLPGGTPDGSYDNTFFSAFTDDLPTDTVDVDLEKAKEIQRNRWRGARKPLLEQFDIEYQRADEAGDTQKKKAIAAKKQAIRDVTLTDLSQVQTAEELAAVWPEILGPNPFIRS